MPKTNGYVKRETRDGEFSGRLKKENAAVLDLYCRVNGINKTTMLNKIVEEWAVKTIMRLRDE
jgi:hypothetical protein